MALEQNAGDRNLPAKGCLVGIDPGRKRVGIAVTDSAQTIAFPITTLTSSSTQSVIQALRPILHEYEAVGLVVGLPLNMDGSEGGQAKQARTFGQSLQQQLELPVAFQDERLTSFGAEDTLLQAGLSAAERKKRRDALAAASILKRFIESSS